jgi:hypothetical protein
MALIWGELKQQIRRSILKDGTPDVETGEYRWSDEELLDFCWWALETFAQHTAVATAASFSPATGLEYNLPDNLYTGEPFDLTGVVYIEKPGGMFMYLDPIRYSELLRPDTSDGFFTHPENTLHLTTAPGEGAMLHIRYFSFYNNPTSDTDTIDIPRWGRTALSYLIGAHALSGAGLKTSTIRQWGAKQDTGTPEHNPLRAQQKWFLDMYEREMTKHTPQDRVNHWRGYDR